MAIQSVDETYQTVVAVAKKVYVNSQFASH
jgi:hypothetical protein